MRVIALALANCLLAVTLFAQGDRGTITGTISDPAGAVVANAPIEARNAQTSAVYQAASTATGNYTLAQLPAGAYELNITVPGFKKYVRQNIEVQVAQTLRIDVALEVGAASESVTVTEAVALLKTESGELSHNVTSDRMNNLPVLGIGGASAGSAGIRNPQAITQLIPGTYFNTNSSIAVNQQLKVNGTPTNTYAFRIDGQDATNGAGQASPQQTQPSVDAIQEVAIQTSNFAAEYGQVGGGFFNFTMKSGTNLLHGSAYDYFVNEVLNASQPFVNVKPTARRNNYGFTLGGPIVLPKLYNGRDKSFFFFNFEQYRETQIVNNIAQTVPTNGYRVGNFTGALTNRTLCTNCDPLGRSILEGTVYDPSTQRLAPNGQIVRDPFAGNIIPVSLFDPVAVKVQAMLPLATSTAKINNIVPVFPSDRVTDIPAVKVDQNVSTKSKVSFYWSRTRTASLFSPGRGGADGLPTPVTGAIGTFIVSHTERLNFDHSITPTLLLHLGAGFQQNVFDNHAPDINYDTVAQLGLKGATIVRQFPQFAGLTGASGTGGVKTLGPGSQNLNTYQKPTANYSLTWVRGNHTYKTGGEFRLDGYPTSILTNAVGRYNFSAAETGLPSTQGQNLSGGFVGFPYASFMLGRVNNGNISVPIDLRLGKTQWGFYAQDTWKVNRKLTLDYGLRWDYMTYLKEQYGRIPQFAPTLANPSASGRPGAVSFEGPGAGHCDCNFGNNYPFAFGPRLGLAYQLNQKTVLRAGFAVVYSSTGDGNALQTFSLSSPFLPTAFGDPSMTLRQGVPPSYVQQWPNLDPGQYPQAGQTGTPPMWVDQNAGRPARQVQWSVGVQREINRDLVVEVNYVGNRGAWWTAPILLDVNANTPERLKQSGLDLNVAADRTVLSSPISSAAAIARGFNKLPYSTFSTGLTVAQSLRPYPQFGTIINWWAPLGSTWYNSLQAKATKRYSRGLSLTSVFTWQKNQTLGIENNPNIASVGSASVNDVFNRAQNKYISAFDQPLIFNLSANYTVPSPNWKGSIAAKTASFVIRGWTLGSFLSYSSGLPIKVPVAQNQLGTYLFRSTYSNRVAGEPLFTKDLNCHCFDPQTEFVLNPKAWQDPAQGQWGTSPAYYGDYRGQRRPQENLSLGRVFKVWEKSTLNIRMEFTNVFNRTQVNDPTSGNALATQTRVNGLTSGGFGFINTATTVAAPRQGTIVARFTF